MTNYIDNTTDDATTYKGKIDESLDLLRGVPVSSTTSGGSAGVDYEVSEWASLTLTTGIMYVFRAHTANTGACHVDQGGSPISIKLADGSNPDANAIVSDGVYFLWYDGTNLVLVNPFSAALTSAPLEDNDLAANGGTIPETNRKNTFSVSGDKSLLVKANSFSSFAVEAYRDSSGEHSLYQGFSARGTESSPSALVDGDQIVSLDARPYEGTGFTYTGSTGTWAATYDSTHTVRWGTNKPVVLGSPTGGAQAEGTANAEDLAVHGTSVTDASILTSGTLDSARLNLLDEDNFASNSATDPASQQSIKAYVDSNFGKVVVEESFSIGGAFSDTGYARSVRGSGGDWIDVYLPIMTHTSNTSPASASGDLPAAYRPGNTIAQCYTATTQLKEVNINNAGTILYDYYDFSGSSTADTSTRFAASLRYFVPD